MRTVSGKGLKVGQGEENPLFVICFAREDYRVITRGASQGSRCSWDLGVRKTRKHLASRITFLELGFCDLRGTDTCQRNPRGQAQYTGTSIITPLIRFLGKRADIRINISSLCHLNNKKTKKGKKRKAQSYLRFPPINLIHLVTRSCWEKKNKDQDSYGWQAS